MKNKTIFQVVIIAAVSLAFSLAYNSVSPDSLPLFRKYNIREVNRMLYPEPANKNYIEVIDTGALKNLIDNDMAVMIDARDKTAFSSGHIPGALHLEPANFDAGFDKISKFPAAGKVIVIYGKDANDSNCRILAGKLTKRIRTNLFIYKGGMADWLKQRSRIESVDNKTAGNNDLER